MSDFAKVKLGDIATVIRGVTFKPPDVIEPDSPNAVACMRTKNVQHVIDLSDVLSIDYSLVSRADQYLQSGDILISSANSWNLVGKCCWVPNLNYPATFGGFISALRTKTSSIEPRYLYHWFSSARIQATVRSFGRKTTNISNLDIKRCLSLEVPIPQLAEQRRIVAVLDQAQALRDRRRESLAQLNELADSTFHSTFGSTEKQYSTWPIIALAEEIREQKIGLVRSSEEFGSSFSTPYVRMNSILKNGDLILDDNVRTDASEAEVKEYSLGRGDFLFNTRNSRELVGKSAVYRDREPRLYNNNIMRIRFTKNLHPEYVAAAFRTNGIKKELDRRKTGTTSVFAIYYKNLKTLPIPHPPIDLQEEFARRIESIERMKQQHRAHLTQLDELFASLQDRAFRGEL